MVAQEYIDGVGSAYYLADKYQVGRATIQKWVALFRAHGIDAFVTQAGNKSYTKEFKLSCVEAVVSGKGSSVDIASQIMYILLRMLSAPKIIISLYLKPLIKLLLEIPKQNHYFIATGAFSTQVKFSKKNLGSMRWNNLCPESDTV